MEQAILLAGLGIATIVIVGALKRMLADVHWLKEPPSYQQLVRSFVTLTFVGSYAFGFLLIVREVTTDTDSLANVEGFGLVLALVGKYVEDIIAKMYAAD